MFWIALLLAQAAVPSQTERGEALFFDAQSGCGNCHALKGKGTAVGPDLTIMGRLAPAAIAMAARSTVTQYVGVAKVKGMSSFPAMTGKKDEQTVVLYDLSKMPPEKKEVAAGDFSMGANDLVETSAGGGEDRERTAGRHRGVYQVRCHGIEENDRSRRCEVEWSGRRFLSPAPRSYWAASVAPAAGPAGLPASR